eukprot:2554223-Pleurochrysis_carterae.AAC.4
MCAGVSNYIGAGGRAMRASASCGMRADAGGALRRRRCAQVRAMPTGAGNAATHAGAVVIKPASLAGDRPCQRRLARLPALRNWAGLRG